MFKQGLVREFSAFLGFGFRIIDLLLVYSSGLLAYYVRFDGRELTDRYELVLLVGVLVAAVVLPVFKLYYSWRGKSLLSQLWALSLAWGAVVLILVVMGFGFKRGEDYSRLWAGIWLLTAWCVLVGYRIVLRVVFNSLRKRGWNHKHVIVVGAGDLGRNVIERIGEANWAGYDVVGIVDDDKNLHGNEILGVTVRDIDNGLRELVTDQNIDEVWLALPLRAEKRLQEVQHLLRHTTVNIRFIPDIFSFRLINHSLSEIAGIPVVDISTTPMDGLNRIIKAVEDKLISSVILLLISPLMIVLAIGVKVSSPGPVFYRQERVGWNGKPFEMLKFRSMPIDTEKNGVQWGGSKDKANTAFGAFIRKVSLDELPQFFNVLIGDMSIVGPRPERTIFVEKFKDEIPDYMKKHMVKAGITGWAQINGWRGDTDLAKRIECDLYYIENWSLWFDLKIIFLTLFKGFVHKNAY